VGLQEGRATPPVGSPNTLPALPPKGNRATDFRLVGSPPWIVTERAFDVQVTRSARH